MRICAHPGCPNAYPDRNTYCPTHRRVADRRRGRRQARGYDTHHDRLRAQWAPRVEAGKVNCWRCGNLIHPGTQWDLGHDDGDRTQYRGPEHATCNRSTAGRNT